MHPNPGMTQATELRCSGVVFSVVFLPLYLLILSHILKEQFNPKMKIQSPSTTPMAMGSRVKLHKTFLELHSRTTFS